MRYAKLVGTTLTAIGLASAITACASPGGYKTARASDFETSSSAAKFALATRAQQALASNDLAGAVSLAEQAVERTPNDAGFRALLGNAYLASGRYDSAEAAYRDSLSIYDNQPQVVLKLALVEIALGKKERAISLLQSSGSQLDAADAGLALALAGEPAQAVDYLENAARGAYADARLRQNLALAHALNGDWENARIVAAQDLSADLVQQRMNDWMAFTSPDRSSSRVASFIGIPMSPADPGQPTRLALASPHDDVRQAVAEPVVNPQLPAQQVATQPVLAETPSEPAPAPVAVAAAPVEQAMPVQVAAFEPLAPPPPPPRPAAKSASSLTIDLPEARPAQKVATATPKRAAKTASPGLSRDAAPVEPALVRKAAFGKSTTVVQLGAYSSRERIELAWSRAVERFAQLRDLTPMTARYDGAQGSLYRLSVKGFGSDREAAALCRSLKAAGGRCFVRRVAGDAPVSFASR